MGGVSSVFLDFFWGTINGKAPRNFRNILKPSLSFVIFFWWDGISLQISQENASNLLVSSFLPSQPITYTHILS